MNLFIALDKKKIKGIFNETSNKCIKKNDCYILPYKHNNPILNKSETLYIFFQYIDNDYKNLKIFDDIDDAITFRDKNFNYGHIVGMKKDKYYDHILNCEYFSVKELN